MSTLYLDDIETEEISNEDLVRAAQLGDSNAFGDLASRFERMVYVVCWQRLRNHDEALEVSQDVFIKAYEKLYQLEEPAAFAGWLRQIAVRQAINRATRRPPSIAVEPQSLDNADNRHVAPLDSLLASERETQLHQGLRRLASLDRSTLEAFYLDGRSINEMSDDFDAPVGTIKRRLHVARKRLARELECLQAV
ncbi:RNA polymerase sigma factor [Bythopirellula goksoeyrii]|uniref:ECF RNA polymerase sigma factor SigW n=1 Tax=Bythopirellula goksoeyrii TaxID=1400387 RepID=A0A5B9QC68_9BACT|nr:sigma-70 family RNA polymerase sigma factor [Bythopirellula goksoeyrii]QEG34506.1 ECF RNA polymerase sigma factor SigW [Bythopirellula goksoeyrii]